MRAIGKPPARADSSRRHPPVVELLFAIAIDQVSRDTAAPAKDLLHSIQVVVEEIGARAAAVALYNRAIHGEAEQAEHLPAGYATSYAVALGRAATTSYQRFRACISVEIGMSNARVAKSTVTKLVMSAAEKCSPATNCAFANHPSISA